MGWAPLPVNAQLDNAAQPAPDGTTAPQATPQPSDIQTPAQAAPAALTGFAPLPANVPLDGEKPAPPDYSAVNEMMRHMYRNGKSVQEIVDFGTHHGVTPNAKQIADARSQGFGDVNFAHPQQATIESSHAEPGVIQQLVDNTKNDVAGIVQGAAALPDAAAKATGKIVSVVPTAVGYGLDALGFHDAANDAHSIAHGLANPLQIGEAVEHVAPTPDTTGGKVNRVVGQLVGGAVGMPTAALENVATRIAGEVPKGFVPSSTAPAAAPAAPDYAQIARELNIKRTPATNSKSGVATVVQSGLGALPGGAPVAAAADREVGGLADATRGVAESVGPVSDRQGAGEAIAQGAQKYKADSKVEANTLYGQRDQLIGGSSTPVPTDEAKAALDDIASRFPNSPAIAALREHPAIRAISGALPGEPTAEEVPTGILDQNGSPITRTVTSGGEPLNLGEVTEALSHVRGVVRNLSTQTLNGKATAPVLARVKQVEQGLENDVMNAARNADIAAGRTPGAEGSAVKAQQDVDAFYADRASALNGSLKKPIKSASDDTQVSGEQVYNQVSGDMDAKSGNLARLRDTWFRLPDQAKSTFAATKIDDLGRASPGNQNDANTVWSFQTFLTNLNKMSPQARNIVFGPKADAQITQIAVYANRLRQLDRARNFSNTAQKYFAGAFMATVGGAVMHGDLGTAADAAMALPATWGGAKLLLSTPAMRDWTAQAMKSLTSSNTTGLRVLTTKLGAIASAQPAIASDVTGLQQAILKAANENGLARVAASPNANAPKQQNGSEAAKAPGARQ